jgi:hypothetical protein
VVAVFILEARPWLRNRLTLLISSQGHHTPSESILTQRCSCTTRIATRCQRYNSTGAYSLRPVYAGSHVAAAATTTRRAEATKKTGAEEDAAAL